MTNNNHIIEQIISQADIVKIIGKHTELKRSGNEFKGNCPFHGEKTPSFYVNPQKGLYKCFGCGVGGNALTFLKEYENMTAGEALRELSRQTGIELPKEKFNSNHTYQRTVKPQNPKPQNVTQGQSKQNRQNSPPQIFPQSPDSMQSLPADYSKNSGQLSSGMPTFPQNLEGSIGENSDYLPNFLPSIAPSLPSNFEYTSDIPAGTHFSTDYQTDFYTNAPPFEGFSADTFFPATPNIPDTVDTNESGAGDLYQLLAQIADFYQAQLYQNPQALQYFYQRGLTDETIQKFMLGYAPEGWQHLEQAFPYDIEGLKILGLVRQANSGRDYDLLRHRVIFPIRDGRGRVVGFAGRALSDSEQPKYINSSDSPVFHKQQILYGLYESRQAKAENFLVVEGYMDVISLYQAGVYGAVAAMGTALATSQVEKLLQYNNVLTLSFDGDNAGQKAAWRTLEVSLPALQDGKELRFLTLPHEHDPDSFVKAFGASAMQKQIETAVPLSDYVFTTLSRQVDISSAEGRNKLLTQVNQLVKKLPKGSYGWLLREDMRAKMGLGRRQQSRAIQDSLLNFTTGMTPQIQLQLCFLYQPELLGEVPQGQDGQLNTQLIDTLFSLSGADKIPLPTTKAGGLLAIPNVYWENIADSDLLVMVRYIQQHQPILAVLFAQQETNYEAINARTHFIWMGLPEAQRQLLARYWGRFFADLSGRGVMDIADLITEIMVQLVLDGLLKLQRQQQDIAISQYLKKQSQAIFNWQRQWLEQKL